MFELEQQVHDARQRAFALHVPANFTRTPHLARADGQAGEVHFLQASAKDFLGQHLAGRGAGLVHVVGEGQLAEALQAILGGEVVPPVGLNFREPLARGDDALVQVS